VCSARKLMSLTSKYNMDTVDLMHIWNNYGMGKLSKCCDSLGIEAKKGMDGSMIYDAYKNKEYKKIREYNLDDCYACVEIAKRIGL
jgi:predicted PolB exonuclease-like 3'-5' exonuclease